MAQPSSKISPLGNYREQPNKAYISTRLFDSASNPLGTLYTYSTSLNGNFQTVGSLQFNTNATAANCPARRVVHANGKVLIPGVHPGGGAGKDPSSLNAVNTNTSTPTTLPFPLVGVYDPVSGLNGYINVQDSSWAVYDVTLGATYDLGLANPDNTLGGDGVDLDEPVTAAAIIASLSTSNGLTSATVTAANITFGSLAVGQTIVGSAGVPASTTITAITPSNSSGTITYTLTLSQAATATGTPTAYAHFVNASGTPHTSYVGQFYSAANATPQIFNTNVRKDSIVLFSCSGAAAPGAPYISAMTDPVSSTGAPGSFTLTFSSAFTGLINYQIIN